MVDMRIAIRELITGFTEGTIVRQPVHIGPGNVYFVPSESEEGGFYIVAKISAAGHPSTWICGCRAFRFEEMSKPCKHINRVWGNEPQVFTSSTTESKSKPQAKRGRSKVSSRRSAQAKTSGSRATGKSSKTTARKSSKSSTRKSTGRKATSKSIGKRGK